MADSAARLHRWETEAEQKRGLVVPPLAAVRRGCGARKGLGSRRDSGGVLLSYVSRMLNESYERPDAGFEVGSLGAGEADTGSLPAAESPGGAVCGELQAAGAAVPPCIQAGVLKDAGLDRQDGCCGLWAGRPGSGLCHLVAPAGPTPGTAPSGVPGLRGGSAPAPPSHLCFPPHTPGPADPARVLNMPPVIYVPVGIHGYIRCPVDAEPPATVVKWNKDGRPLQVEKVPEGRVPVAGGPWP